jgi:hypothetical protein
VFLKCALTYVSFRKVLVPALMAMLGTAMMNLFMP